MRTLRLMRIMASRAPEIEPPEMLVLKITQRCNLHCAQCALNTLDYYDAVPGSRDAQLTKEQCFEFLAQGHDLGIKRVVITGGEPAMHPNLRSILGFAKMCGYSVELATNGILLDPERLTMLQPEDWVHLSIDKMHQFGSRMGIEEYREAMLARIWGIRKLKHRPRVSMRITAREIEGTPYLSGLVDLTKRNPLNVFEPHGPARFKCPFPWYYIAINPDATISPCCMAEDVRFEGPEVLNLLWRLPDMMAWRYRLLTDDPPNRCRTCPRYARSPIEWLKKARVIRRIQRA